jgi:hypothetical protein
LDLEFSVNSFPEINSAHPNKALYVVLVYSLLLTHSLDLFWQANMDSEPSSQNPTDMTAFVSTDVIYLYAS